MSEPFDFRRAFIDKIESAQRVFSHDRSKTLGASEAFGCLRRAWFSKFASHLADSGAMSLGAAERGNIIENHYVVPKLYEIFGKDKVKYAGEDQITLVKDKNSATPDSLIFPDTRDILTKYNVPDIGTDCFGAEIKSVDPRINLQEEKFVHRGQAIIQMGLFRDLTDFQPNYNVILYINAADFYDIRPFVVKYDPDVYRTAQQRADTLFKTADPYDIRAEGVLTGQCRYCPFQTACRDSELSRFPKGKSDLTDNETSILVGMAQKYKEVDAEAAKKEAEKKVIGEDIKRFLNAMGTKGATVPGYSVSYSKLDGRETLDTEAMEADGIDLSPYKKQGSGYTRLQVTRKDDT